MLHLELLSGHACVAHNDCGCLEEAAGGLANQYAWPVITCELLCHSP